MNYRRLLVVICALLLVLTALGLGIRARLHSAASDNKLAVTATFYPMAEFARQVGGSSVAVTTLVQPGVEPHDYEPKPTDIARIYSSKVFVYNGAGLEQWIGKLDRNLAANHVTAINASKGIALLGVEPNHNEALSATDPHIWMDPVLAEQQVRNIEAGLATADPVHAATYHQNARRYVAQLQALDQAFRSGLAHCAQHDIITSHQAFAYLARQYGLTATGIAGLSPDNEPSPATLASVALLAKQKNVQYIFFETLVSPRLAQTVAQEVGAQTITFNPLEGLTPSQVKAGQNYLTVQHANLQALRTALHCTL
jgi:zinc transport system substrate-binding protein